MQSWRPLSAVFYPVLPDHCDPTTPFLAFLSSRLHTCIPTHLALLSTSLGCLSIASWLFAQLPQIFKNYALQSTSGLSIYFLIEWCLGDTTNLFGALLTRQATWQVVVAAYYVFVDVTLVWQYLWYTHLKPRRQSRRQRRFQFGDGTSDGGQDVMEVSGELVAGVSLREHEADSHQDGRSAYKDVDRSHAAPLRTTLAHPISPDFPSQKQERSFYQGYGKRLKARSRTPSPLISPKTLVVVSLLGVVVSAHPASPSHALSRRTDPSPSNLDLAGTLLSWTSTLLYLGSRLPQIYKNQVRRSTAGLSAKLFIAAFFGNLFYSSSLLTNPCAWADLPSYGGRGWAGPEGSDRADWVARAAPFWLGAAGVLSLDAAIGVQFWMFGEGGGPEVTYDERGRWHRVTGWMKGWAPRVGSPSPKGGESDETQRLIASDGESYGSA